MLDPPLSFTHTHRFYKGSKKISATAIFFEAMPYHVNPDTGFIDYDRLAAVAADFCPKVIVCGGSAYPREWDYKKFREIADSVGALLLCDMAHISGLVAGGVAASPFEYCHIVTSTTHKTLRGPRSGIIFFRKDKELNLEARINAAVFPGMSRLYARVCVCVLVL
jgi:glycine hydroxymethyltransferase